MSYNKFSWIVSSVLLLVSCEYPQKASFVKAPLRGELFRVRWVDSVHALQFVTRVEDTGFNHENRRFYMEKFRSTEGDSAYLLDIYYSNTYVHGDTLYIWDNSTNIGTGWYEIKEGVIQQVGYKDIEYNFRNKSSLFKNKITMLEKKYGGMYKYDSIKNDLIKVENEANRILDMIKDDNDGIYYIPFPGVGLKDKIYLRSYSEKIYNDF